MRDKFCCCCVFCSTRRSSGERKYLQQFQPSTSGHLGKLTTTTGGVCDGEGQGCASCCCFECSTWSLFFWLFCMVLEFLWKGSEARAKTKRKLREQINHTRADAALPLIKKKRLVSPASLSQVLLFSMFQPPSKWAHSSISRHANGDSAFCTKRHRAQRTESTCMKTYLFLFVIVFPAVVAGSRTALLLQFSPVFMPIIALRTTT